MSHYTALACTCNENWKFQWIREQLSVCVQARALVCFDPRYSSTSLQATKSPAPLLYICCSGDCSLNNQSSMKRIIPLLFLIISSCYTQKITTMKSILDPYLNQSEQEVKLKWGAPMREMPDSVSSPYFRAS